jgi:hypothetical protein
MMLFWILVWWAVVTTTWPNSKAAMILVFCGVSRVDGAVGKSRFQRRSLLEFSVANDTYSAAATTEKYTKDVRITTKHK